jgi:hypothetical protein
LGNYGVFHWTNDNDLGGITLGDGAEIFNQGQFNVQCDTYMVDSSTNPATAAEFYNGQFGTVSKTAKTATTVFQPKFVDAGKIVAQSGILEFVHFQDNYPNTPLPAIILQGGTIQFDNDPTVHAVISGSGQINAPQGLVLSGGQLIVITIIFDGDITDDEVFDLSEFFGVITFAGGNFTETANATLIVPVQSANPNGGYGKISNPSSVTLGGTLQVVLTNGYAPPVGARFPFLNSGQLSNMFSKVILPEGLTVTYTNSGAAIVVTNVAPAILAVPQIASGQLVCNFNTVPNTSYTVQFTSNLNNPVWTVLTNFVASTTNVSFTLPVNSGPTEFIRVAQP